MRSPSPRNPDPRERNLPPIPQDALSYLPEAQNVGSATGNGEVKSPGHADAQDTSDAQHAGSHSSQSRNINTKQTNDFMRRRREDFKQGRRLDRNGGGTPNSDSTLHKKASRTSNSDSIQQSDVVSSPPSPTLAAGAL